MVMGFNRRWIGAPRLQLVNNANDTVHAVQRALDAGLRITVRGGGHCYENFSSGNYGGVIVDLSNMQNVYMDRPGQGLRGGRRHLMECLRDALQEL